MTPGPLLDLADIDRTPSTVSRYRLIPAVAAFTVSHFADRGESRDLYGTVQKSKKNGGARCVFSKLNISATAVVYSLNRTPPPHCGEKDGSIYHGKFGSIFRSFHFKAINPRDIRLEFFVKFIEVLQQNMSETATKSRPVNIRKFLILSLIEVSALRTVEFNAT